MNHSRSFKPKMQFFLRLLSLIPLIILLCVIFDFSAQNGTESSNVSMRTGRVIVSCFDRIFHVTRAAADTEALVYRVHRLVRKLAHITEYFLLTLSFFLPLFVLFSDRYAVLRGRKKIIWAVLLTVLCAAFDEFHQFFVPGRSGKPLDVCIDSIGILVAALLLLFLTRKKKSALPQP